jgi:hydroxyethylthiazole kinase-like uncharacterized protein yjeF
LASVQGVLNSVSAISPDIILMPLTKIDKESIKNFQAVSIGCGLSTEKYAVKLFKKMIKFFNNSETPVVIDADGLGILALRHCETRSIGEHKNFLPKQSCPQQQLPPNTILTPHPLELARLMNITVENILLQPEFWVKKCSDKYNCTTVLKMHETMVADNKGKFYVNKTGNSALSHGGSGDVLCGMITGFLASGMPCFNASTLAVYLHGLTAEIASAELTEYSVLASDLLNYIPEALKTIL